MIYVLGGLVAVFIVALVVGGVTGRVKMRSCCVIADPAQDPRMRAAFARPAPAGTDDPASTDDPPGNPDTLSGPPVPPG